MFYPGPAHVLDIALFKEEADCLPMLKAVIDEWFQQGPRAVQRRVKLLLRLKPLHTYMDQLEKMYARLMSVDSYSRDEAAIYWVGMDMMFMKVAVVNPQMMMHRECLIQMLRIAYKVFPSSPFFAYQ